MKITYLGHAGFCLETPSTLIIMDPWLSKNGAFDAAWFQYPKNHHLADSVQKLLANSSKDKYLYLSHEHKDHFDFDFLKTIQDPELTIVLADFVRPIVKNSLQEANYQCKQILSLKDNEELALKDGKLVLFSIDMELDCDSAILVKTSEGSFLNLNDCKLHERLACILADHGPIDIFAAQFSGAVWHPTCYLMDDAKYELICRHKIERKFEQLAKALELLKPKVYLPSAGPPCFLDPALLDINFQEINTYPRAKALIDFLNQRFAGSELSIQWPELMPGDIFDLNRLDFSYLAPERVDDKDFKNYVLAYAEEYAAFFQKRAEENSKVKPEAVFLALKDEFSLKLAAMKKVWKNLPLPLYFALDDYPQALYRIDFTKGLIETREKLDEEQEYFFISTPAWQINKVLTKEISWPDFALTFRAKLQRKPDVYNTLAHGFLTLDEESLARFCELFFEIFAKEERIEIKHQGKTYSVLRYCPHQGGDLLQGWVEDCFLVCPRHQWRFDLENGGKCRYNEASIDARCISEE